MGQESLPERPQRCFAQRLLTPFYAACPINLSGGVGGAFLLRYGTQAQTFLHDHLRQSGHRLAVPGTSVVTPSCGSPYTAIAHAVAIDVFYDTDADRIFAAYCSGLEQLSNTCCQTVAAACLGCGYGRCSFDVFAAALKRLIVKPFSKIESVTLVTTNAELAAEIQKTLAAF